MSFINGVSCNGESDAGLEVVAVPVAGTYTYEWIKLSDPTTVISTNDTATGLSAGDYQVTATLVSGGNSIGCEISTVQTVAEPPVLEAFVIENNGINCQGENTGSAFAAVSGGRPPYTYLWDDPNAQTTAAATGLSAGTYQVTVTDTSGCLTTSQVTITEPSALEATVTVNTMLTCEADNNGEASVAVTGGNGPYSYQWDDNNLQTTATASGLSVGTYQITVTDANACTTTESVTLNATDDEAPTVICQDITVDLDATGNASIVAEDIDNGSTDNCAITSYQLDTNTFDCTMIGANTVMLTLTDANGNSASCSSVVTVQEVTQPTLSCASITVNLDENGNVTISPEDLLTTANDNCGTTNLSIDMNTFDCGDVGEAIEVILTVEDPNGNTTNCLSEVIVNDVTAPVINCMEEMNVLADTDNNTYTVPDFLSNQEVTVTDNCDDNTIETIQTPPAGTSWELGEHTLTFTAEDESGNVNTCSILITVTTDLKIDSSQNALRSLQLYPVPAKDYFIIDNPQKIKLEEIIIYDFRGRSILKIGLSNGIEEEQVNISTLSVGGYFVIIKGKEDTTIVKKIIKN